jgi:hypothetical protein
MERAERTDAQAAGTQAINVINLYWIPTVLRELEAKLDESRLLEQDGRSAFSDAGARMPIIGEMS